MSVKLALQQSCTSTAHAGNTNLEDSEDHPKSFKTKKGQRIPIKYTKVLSKTLQGCTYLGINPCTNEEVVVKIASLELYNKGVTKTEFGDIIKIKEDIIKEAKVMKYCESKNPPKGIYYFTLNFPYNYYKTNVQQTNKIETMKP